MNNNEIRYATDMASATMRAIGNEKRLLVMMALASQGERYVGQLQAFLAKVGEPLSQSALSQHLAILRDAEVVKVRRESQAIFYSINEKSDVRAVLEALGVLGLAKDV
ncbi:metalloregulator ArsR/SmtB family transcription factor [Vreelandella rituensis]|uniref:ArsR family transcriptional regulator n=1 Tax=Vreelandella rituensis TaxID=2282306 RepID=A0A368UAJ4_9GAMM|nr:metalloregulator ArsR/SmtB family transcription factor [Halomonas rituensis]RCV93626.1 ArsR family transcriptional regulator [Halomonas rituensis]